MLNQISRHILRTVSTRQPAALAGVSVRGAHHAVENKNAFPPKHVADMDDLPQVGGSWQEEFDARNARWNKQLAASVVLFVACLVGINQTVFFNAFPPELPEEMKTVHPWKDHRRA